MKNAISKTHRKEWIDALRAFAMINVAFGHQIRDYNQYFVFACPIMVTLFFSVTGYVFNSNIDFNTFFYKLFRRLVVPWIVFSTIPVLFISAFKGTSYFYSHFKDIIYGVSNWYLPCCIIGEILWYFILKAKKINIIFALSLLCFVCGQLLCKYDLLNILMINRSFSIIVYFFLGYALKNIEGKYVFNRNLFIAVGCISYILLGVLTLNLYPEQYLDLHMNLYYNYPICFMMVVIGVGILFVLVKQIDHFSYFVLQFGQNTMIVYLYHNYVAQAISKILNLIHFPDSLILKAAITVLSCIICTVISIFLKRFVPYLFGINRHYRQAA